MVNVTKIKDLAKKKGIKMGYLCDSLGVGETYLRDVSRGKNSMSEERVFKIAEILGTTFEYLTDLTDDPAPDFLLKMTITTQERLAAEVIEKMNTLTDEQTETIKKLLDLSEEKLDKVLGAVKMMIE